MGKKRIKIEEGLYKTMELNMNVVRLEPKVYIKEKNHLIKFKTTKKII
jgi:hypothetical protein